MDFQTVNFPAGDFTSPEYTDVDSSASDCESGISDNSSSTGVRHLRRRIFDESLAVEISEHERNYQIISGKFLSSMVDDTEIVSIHRRNWSADLLAQARVQSFLLHAKALAPGNLKFGWYGASFQRIKQILSRGFSFLDLQDSNNNGVIFLSPDHSPAQSVDKSVPDEDGIRHLLLCRVLLGRSELIRPDSTQIQPSCNEFDSGVDDFENPSKYLIWSHNMNSHILPEYIVSFTTPVFFPPSVCGIEKIMQKGMKTPPSPWISFPTLISVLAKFLPHDAVCLISKYHHQYKERKLSRAGLIKIVRQIAGDKLLISVIKSCKGAKELKMPFGFLRNRMESQQVTRCKEIKNRKS